MDTTRLLRIRHGPSRNAGLARVNAPAVTQAADALTPEERLLRDTAREFAQREVAPTAIERDEAERFDRSIFTRMGELGLTAAPLPEPVGGGGFS